MSAWLYGQPFAAEKNLIISPILLALIAAIITLTLMFIIKLSPNRWRYNCTRGLNGGNTNKCKSNEDEHTIDIRNVSGV